MTYKFNVFGKIMSVAKIDNEWLLFLESETSLRSRVYDVVIPNELSADELLTYLDDIYHEYSSDKNPRVIQIN